MRKQTTKKRSTSQASITKKFVRESESQAKRDLVERWRFLRKIGAYETKETAAQIRLTKHRIREIEKRFREVQKSMRTIKRGKIQYPVSLKSYKTPSGKVKMRYELGAKFQFVRTKRVPKVKAGTHKTKRGYILQKAHADGKITISKSGDIIETRGRTRRRITQYKQEDLLKLIEDFDKGKKKLRKNEMVIFHKFGSPHMTIEGGEDELKLVAKYIEEASKTFDPVSFQRFWDHSYLEFVEDMGDDSLDLT